MAEVERGFMPSVIDDDTESDAYLVCPECKCELVHPVAITCNPAGNDRGEVRIDSRGLCKDVDAKTVGRGVLLTQEYHCENGHRFKYSWHFHKGSTYCSIEMLRGITDEEVEEFAITTLWRD